MDWNYRRLTRKHNLPVEKKRAADLRNFPIEKARLQPVFIMAPLVSVTCISFGWAMQRRANLAVPLILEFIMGYVQVSASNNLSSLLVDLFPDRPSTATAASNLMRCWIGGGMTAAISPMLSGMGWGWCFTFLGLLYIPGMALLWLEYKRGMRWRAERREREQKVAVKTGGEQ